MQIESICGLGPCFATMDGDRSCLHTRTQAGAPSLPSAPLRVAQFPATICYPFYLNTAIVQFIARQGESPLAMMSSVRLPEKRLT